MNVSISICPTDLEVGNQGDLYDKDALLAAIREYIEEQHPDATITCLQVGHRQGDKWAKIDGDREAGAALMAAFYADRGDDEDLLAPALPPVMVEVASCDETIRICGGLEDFAGLEHTAIHDACEAYHRAATDALRGVGRLNWCVPRRERILHRGWAGAKFAYSVGALGTMAADLTDDEKAAIDAAHDAGLEAAKNVIEVQS